jgi:uncharacterized protein with HEPN domain
MKLLLKQRQFMVDRDLVRLRHMLDSCEAILSFVKGKNRKELDTNLLLTSAIIRQLEILGEAAVAVSLTTKEKFPHIPWKQAISMRNRLIHTYFDIDNETIWKTINNDIPALFE